MILAIITGILGIFVVIFKSIAYVFKYIFDFIYTRIRFLVEVIKEDTKSINFRKNYFKKQQKMLKLNNEI